MYKIKRWDVVTSNNLEKHPIIYIDSELEEGRNFLVKIDGTDTPYDRSVIRGVIHKTLVPVPYKSVRKEQTIIALCTDWHEYPCKMGTVRFVEHGEIEGERDEHLKSVMMKEKIERGSVTKVGNTVGKNLNKNLNNTEIVSIVSVILLLIAVLQFM